MITSTTGWKSHVRCAAPSEREVVRKFVVGEHLRITGYNAAAMAYQISELPTDYPELYDDFVFNNSMCWVCYNGPCEDSSLESTGTVSLGRAVDGQEMLKVLGCIGIKYCSTDTVEIGYFFVDEQTRGLGLGRLLLNTAINWARNHRNYPLCNPMSHKIESPEYRYIRLITLRNLMETAVSMYQRSGFKLYEECQYEHFKVAFMRLVL